ncbi:MAG: ribbon-helix-helix protein, CopG family [Phascolarctobacterium sp.]|nr:ribbon-helix-helix protein, CopG family [Candidatus Phascolarctobacterium caballi]
MTSIRVYDDSEDKLDWLSELNDCTVADIVEEMIEEYLENHDLKD